MFFPLTTVLPFFALGLLSQIHGAALHNVGQNTTSRVGDNILRPIDLNKRATASELFSFRDASEGGGCSTTQISTLDDWLAETVVLHNAALSAMNFGSIPADPMHLTWIMGMTFAQGAITNPEQWNKIQSKMSSCLRDSMPTC